MERLVLQGMVTADGKLQVEVPPDWKPGPVEIELRRPEVPGVRLGDMLEDMKKLGLVGMWADREDIQDNVEFARELRRRASRRGES